MGNIKVLRDYNGTAVYPQTVTSAIYSTDNQTLDTILSSKATKEEVDNRFNNFSSLDIQVVSELPAEGSSTSIYLLQVDGGTAGNLYEEYLYVNNTWEMIGSTQVDLSEYNLILNIGTLTTSEEAFRQLEPNIIYYVSAFEDSLGILNDNQKALFNNSFCAVTKDTTATKMSIIYSPGLYWSNDYEKFAINFNKKYGWSIDFKNEALRKGVVTNFWAGTQADYDAIASKSATTLYMITG